MSHLGNFVLVNFYIGYKEKYLLYSQVAGPHQLQAEVTLTYLNKYVCIYA